MGHQAPAAVRTGFRRRRLGLEGGRPGACEYLRGQAACFCGGKYGHPNDFRLSRGHPAWRVGFARHVQPNHGDRGGVRACSPDHGRPGSAGVVAPLPRWACGRSGCDLLEYRLSCAHAAPGPFAAAQQGRGHHDARRGNSGAQSAGSFGWLWLHSLDGGGESRRKEGRHYGVEDSPAGHVAVAGAE